MVGDGFDLFDGDMTNITNCESENNTKSGFSVTQVILIVKQ